MVERRMELEGVVHLVVSECRGNLRVRSGDKGAVVALVQGKQKDLEWTREGDRITAIIGADATLTCPAGTRVTLERVLGNLRIEGITGQLHVDTTHGNGTVRAVGMSTLQRVLGNLRARDVAGPLEVGEVRGNSSIRGVQGRLVLGEVAGNLDAGEVEGGLTAEIVRGNVLLRPPFPTGAEYHLAAGGNLSLALPADASVRLAVRSGGMIDARYPGLALEQKEDQMIGLLGEGGATIEVDVRGNVSVRSSESDREEGGMAGWEELGAHIEWQVHDAMAKMAEQLEERLGRAGGEWVRHRVDTATLEARRRAEQAAERARMRAERAERRWRRAAGEPAVPQREGPTDEERLRVLRMVEEGRITPEQASDLLGAIEGR